jgi:Tfp pilus assembly PilM family ATPase
MRFGDKTAAGIDISQDRISIVLLKSGKNGPELVKSVSAPMPQGVWNQDHTGHWNGEI